MNVEESVKTYKAIVSPILQYCSATFVFECMYVWMYAFASFLMIKSGVFVSALKIDGYNKNKFTIKIFTIRYEKLKKLTNLTSVVHHTKGHWNNKKVQIKQSRLFYLLLWKNVMSQQVDLIKIAYAAK